jgi:hypothetical protein
MIGDVWLGLECYMPNIETLWPTLISWTDAICIRHKPDFYEVH